MTVDDESSVRRAIRAVLKREGFSVREAASWYEALDIMKQEPGIAMVLSDMRISGMDGNSLAHRLFAVRPMCAQCAPNVRLMFVSGFDGDLDDCCRHCPRLGKPFNGKELISRVRTQLEYTAGA